MGTPGTCENVLRMTGIGDELLAAVSADDFLRDLGLGPPATPATWPPRAKA